MEALQLHPRQTSSMDILQVCQRFTYLKVLGEIPHPSPCCLLRMSNRICQTCRLCAQRASKLRLKANQSLLGICLLACARRTGKPPAVPGHAACREASRCQEESQMGRRQSTVTPQQLQTCCFQSSTDLANMRRWPPGCSHPERRF